LVRTHFITGSNIFYKVFVLNPAKEHNYLMLKHFRTCRSSFRIKIIFETFFSVSLIISSSVTNRNKKSENDFFLTWQFWCWSNSGFVTRQLEDLLSDWKWKFIFGKKKISSTSIGIALKLFQQPNVSLHGTAKRNRIEKNHVNLKF
jgi:hypothetical protein